MVREVVESSTTASALHVAVGDIITVAGNGTSGYKGDGGPATKAELDEPTGVALDSAGDIFIADSDNDVIREVVESSSAATALGVAKGDIVTVAGDGTLGYIGNGGAATKAELNDPVSVALDSNGDIFIADEFNQVIREVVESSSAASAYHVSVGDIITVAGTDSAGFTGGYSGDKGPATGAELNNPTGVALDSAGDILIADYDNNRIREVVESTTAATALGVAKGDIVTVAGDGTSGYTGDGHAATKAELDSPSSVAVDGAGDLFIADSSNNVVREVVQSSGDIITVAGDGTLGYGGDGGPATSASLDYPWDVALDAAGDLFIADSGNNVIREAVATDAATSTGLTSSENPSPFAYALTFTATVSDTSNPGTTPTGTVQFTIDGNDYGGPVALVDGQASIGDGTLAAGAHSIVAIYTPGSSAFVTSTSSLTQTVDPGPTTLNLDAYDGPAVNPPPFAFTTSVTAVYGEAVSITANLTPPYGGSPTGTITFFDGGTVLGILPLPIETSFVTVTTSSLPVGTSSITASYSGSPDFASSTSVQAATVMVTKAGTNVVLSSEQGKKVKGAYTITITARNRARGPRCGGSHRHGHSRDAAAEAQEVQGSRQSHIERRQSHARGQAGPQGEQLGRNSLQWRRGLRGVRVGGVDRGQDGLIAGPGNAWSRRRVPSPPRRSTERLDRGGMSPPFVQHKLLAPVLYLLPETHRPSSRSKGAVVDPRTSAAKTLAMRAGLRICCAAIQASASSTCARPSSPPMISPRRRREAAA